MAATDFIRTVSEGIERAADAHIAIFIAVGGCIGAGLIMRCWWRFRTLPGMAVIGVISLTAIYRERVIDVYFFSLAAYGYVRLVRACRLDRWRLAVLGIAVLVGVFLYQSTIRDQDLTDFPPAGGLKVYLDMLLLLRLVLFVWEYGAGRFDWSGSVEYLAWCGLPFTAGAPFLRYSQFQRQPPWNVVPLPPVGWEWWAGVAASIGLFAASIGLTGLQAGLNQGPWYGRLLVLYGTSPWSFYLTAAATFRLFRYAGSLGGLAIPVNYNAPFRSRNISVFWMRWNITATNAFRDMLFFNRWGLAKPNLYVNTIIVFVVVGLWHGVNGYWVLWGLMHGLGFCIFILWKQWRGPVARPLPTVVGWALTYFFVCSCWAVPPQILKLAHRTVSVLSF